MIGRTAFVGALIFALSWSIGYYVTLTLLQGMTSATAYALIVGWWFTAYVSSIFAWPLASVIPLAIGYFSMFLVARATGQPWFYGGVAQIPWSASVVIGLAQAFAVCGLLFFDWLFRQTIQIFRRAK